MAGRLHNSSPVRTGLLLALFGLSLAVAVLALYADRNLFDAERFADRVESSLEQPDVRRYAAARISAELIRADPDLIAVEPLVRGAAEGVVGSAAFRAIARGAAYQAHATAFGAGEDTFALTASGAALLVVEALEANDPQTAARVPDGLRTTLLSISDGSIGGALADLAQTAERLRLLGWIALALAIASLAAALLPRQGRRAVARSAGYVVAAVGALLAAALTVARGPVCGMAGSPEAEAAARRLWDAFMGDLLLVGLSLAGAGLVVAAVADSRVRALSPAERARALLAAAVRTPRRTGRRTLRAVALVVVGILVVAAPETALRLAAIAGGLFLVALGVDEILELTAPPRDEGADRPGRRGRRRPAIVAALLLGALAVPVLVAISSDEIESRFGPTTGCNGFEELCERRIDEVVLPATHNSMSSPEGGFLFPDQQRGIAAQLESGVRGLLIDTHMAVRTEQGAYTLLEEGGKSRGKLEGALGPEATRTAERLRGQIRYQGGGDKRVYLCHGFCELGALDAVAALREVREFLLADPGAVVVIAIEDQVTPAATAEVFERSGLLELVWTGSIDPLPTLGEMVERNRRALVFGEEDTVGVPWYHQQFETVKETPYDIPTAEALLASCRQNRGAAGNPVLLINQFVGRTPPLPSVAREVNGVDDIVGRAARCAPKLGRPNLIAVDFWQEGDVVAAAAVLNRVR